MSSRAAAAARRLEAALELWEDGVAIKRENLERRFPKASAAQIDRMVRAWLADRPPDADGVRVAWPRPRRGSQRR